MRKLHLQMQMSVDGFVSTGPNDEQKWVTLVWAEIKTYVIGLLDATDTILIGRKLAVDYIPHWQGVAKQPNDPFHGVAERICQARKVVFTKTVNKSEWKNADLATGELVEEVKELKSTSGKDIVAYGGSSFVSALLKERLVDEFHFFVNPIALGKGETVFSELEDWQAFQLKKSIAYDCGLVLLNYELK
jgi:dihydrofolate reductase